jgi:molybdopterin/thiamine biosynthesis adenylyltransferase
MEINHISLIGVGGGGASALTALAPAYDMTLHDGDDFEERNIQRQVFAAHGIGKNKADCLAGFYKEGDKNIVSSPHMIKGNEELETDLIFCCVDNNYARKAAYELANIHEVPLILIANEDWNPMAWLYIPEFEFDNRNPFTRWKLDQLTEGRQQTCAGTEIIEEIPQLPQANHVSAGHGLTILQSLLMYKKVDNYIAEAMSTPWPTYKHVRDIDTEIEA